MRIDSLTKFDELIAAGTPIEQARVLAHSLTIAGEVDLDVIATKHDIKHLEKTMYFFGILIFSCLGYLMFGK
jgi:hypothetical protein